MPGTADKFTQSAQGRLLRPGVTSFAIAKLRLHAFLREKNALKAATASLERIRSPNKWPS
jgi:hypothetical protein